VDDQLRGEVNETWRRYCQNRTTENLEAFEQAVRVFADWVLQGKLPEDSK
jgi:hypothetical protein